MIPAISSTLRQQVSGFRDLQAALFAQVPSTLEGVHLHQAPRGYTRLWQHVKANPDKQFWVMPLNDEMSGRDLRAYMVRAMDHRINSRGGITFSSRMAHLEQEQRWDRGDLERLRRRVRIYHFRSSAVVKRFGHLCSSRED